MEMKTKTKKKRIHIEKRETIIMCKKKKLSQGSNFRPSILDTFSSK